MMKNIYIKSMKIYAGSVITNLHNKKMSKEKVPYKCLSLIMPHSVIKTDNKYYPQTFLEECEYIWDKIKTKNYINDKLEETEPDNDNDEDDEDDEDGE